MTRHARYQGRRYIALDTPLADCDRLADQGDRLMFKHAPLSLPDESGQLFVAQKGDLHSGWVLGIFIDTMDDSAMEREASDHEEGTFRWRTDNHGRKYYELNR